MQRRTASMVRLLTQASSRTWSAYLPKCGLLHLIANPLNFHLVECLNGFTAGLWGFLYLTFLGISNCLATGGGSLSSWIRDSIQLLLEAVVPTKGSSAKGLGVAAMLCSQPIPQDVAARPKRLCRRCLRILITEANATSVKVALAVARGGMVPRLFAAPCRPRRLGAGNSEISGSTVERTGRSRGTVGRNATRRQAGHPAAVNAAPQTAAATRPL
mmetsp:Transcript_59040/g.137465  ORF Transcript_59040/g.137465 Transcript_59040/m.137465 type:complete len:215 (+) Transcript_59040:515-1159(+)